MHKREGFVTIGEKQWKGGWKIKEDVVEQKSRRGKKR